MDVVSFINSLPSARPLHLNQQLACPLCLGCVWLLENVFWKIHIFRKRKMFPWCLVAFQKIFRKIFSGVWKRRRKTQIQKNTSHNPDRAIRRSRSRSRLLREIAIDGAISRSIDSNLNPVRSLEGKIASTAISIRCNLAKVRSQSRSGCEIAINDDWNVCRRDHDRRGLELGVCWRSSDWLECFFSSRACARSLSLSIKFPEILWRENRSVKWFLWSKAFFFYQRISFSGK